jgi:hypothetical protein
MAVSWGSEDLEDADDTSKSAKKQGPQIESPVSRDSIYGP